jgi:PPOX class probable F420-dependent enzyme
MTDPVPAPAAIPIPAEVRTFLDDIKFATIATVDPDGAPRQAVVWYTLRGDVLVLNSAVGRRWPTNLVRDPRISLSIADPADGYRWIGISGRVTVVDDQPTAQADIAAMARRYHAHESNVAERLIRDRFERQERISFHVHVDAIHDHLD